MTIKQLRMARAAGRWKLSELADAVGMTTSHLSRIESESASPSADTMRRLERFFTGHGFEFSSRDDFVCVCAPDPIDGD